jgi:hypothetical protein
VFVSFLCLNFFSHFVDEILFLSNALAKIRIHDFFNIFSISILQKYMVGLKFSKTIHLPSWPTAAGVLPPRGTAAWAVAHWQGHIPPWATALGPYRRGARRYEPTVGRQRGPQVGFFLVNFNF